MMQDVLSRSAVEQARLIRERQISSVELMQAHREQIARVNPQINAVIEVLDRGDAPQPGPLHGVPFSIKDSIEVAGSVCTAGTLGRKHAAPSVADATLVARLRAAGALPLAHTNLPDLLFAFESDNLLFGATRNPYDPARTSGGSSGGEAALIASCGSPLGLGSDCAGSVRLPAAFCGIAGIKPTSGRLPRTGHFPPSGGWIEALWQIGPMARYVEDLIAVMPLLIGTDGCDVSTVSMPFHDPRAVELRDLRVAFYTDNGIAAADEDVSRVVRAAAKSLASEVRGIEEARPHGIEQSYDLEMKLIGADGGDGLWQYLQQLGSTAVHPLLRGWLDKLEVYRTDLAGLQSYWAEWDAYRTGMFAFLRDFDVILCPAYIHAALPHGTSTLDANFRGFSHTMAFNLTGWPAAVVRCGETSGGLPVAVQVVARPWREDVALRVAAALEETFGGWKAPRTEPPNPTPVSEE
ncbi:MAG TPA: amidase [Bryobacteraceae bacterium]|nr:amidase [Bryobacteraceae bacterium]